MALMGPRREALPTRIIEPGEYDWANARLVRQCMIFVRPNNPTDTTHGIMKGWKRNDDVAYYRRRRRRGRRTLV